MYPFVISEIVPMEYLYLNLYLHVQVYEKASLRLIERAYIVSILLCLWLYQV